MASQFFDKFSAEILDFPIDCSAALPNGDKISAGGALVESSDLTIITARTAIDATGKIVTFWCSGGEPGKVAKVVCTIQTDGGRTRQTHSYIVIKPL
jgi:hypothetical protein